MEKNMLDQYVVIGKIQNAISKASTLEEALNDSLRVILDAFNIEYVISWYASGASGEECLNLGSMHWVCPYLQEKRKQMGLQEGLQEGLQGL